MWIGLLFTFTNSVQTSQERRKWLFRLKTIVGLFSKTEISCESERKTSERKTNCNRAEKKKSLKGGKTSVYPQFFLGIVLISALMHVPSPA